MIVNKRIYKFFTLNPYKAQLNDRSEDINEALKIKRKN